MESFTSLQYIATISTAAGVIVTAILGLVNKKQLATIHLLVNDRLDRALAQNAALLTQLSIVHGDLPDNRNMSDVLRTAIPGDVPPQPP